MLFQSAGFILLFLPLFLALMALTPKGWPRTTLVVAFSYLFYSGNEPQFAILLLISTVVDYQAALFIARSETPGRRKLGVAISALTNLSLLGFFKYGGLIAESGNSVASLAGLPTMSTEVFSTYVLPAGISFYTFQSMAYTIDVYRGHTQPERSFLSFMNYVAYLPQLIAGPIERHARLAPQLATMAKGRLFEHWSAGLDRIALGVVQKLFIADACGRIVDAHLAAGTALSTIDSWVVSLAFALQIYFDFAAYTHIAIGIALMMGVRLSENFLSPYKAHNIRDFWRRWHMTLSAWFRDYVYIPLGGSRGPRYRTAFNLSATFLLCGLWHGASWNFVAWGAFHGIFISLHRLSHGLRQRIRIPKLIAIVMTFVVVLFSWVLFRVTDMGLVADIWLAMLGFAGDQATQSSPLDWLILGLFSVGVFALPNALERWPGSSGALESGMLWTLAAIAIFSTPEIEQFIYFQF